MGLVFRAMPASIKRINVLKHKMGSQEAPHIQHTPIAKAFPDKDYTCFVRNGSIDVNTVRD